jgi:pSer/pThr/pTyr-binding forkhead associated (FHA) protein
MYSRARYEIHIPGLLSPLVLDEGDAIVLGRDAEAGYVFAEDVSPRHARFLAGSDGVLLTDLKSGGGTFVNGLPVLMSMVSSGDVIRLGETEIRVNMAAPVLVREAIRPLAQPPSTGASSGWRR